MTVAELIKKLKKYPPEMRVVDPPPIDYMESTPCADPYPYVSAFFIRDDNRCWATAIYLTDRREEVLII